MNANPMPWESFLPKAPDGSLQGAMTEARWKDIGQSAAVLGHWSPYYAMQRGGSPHRRRSLGKPNLLVGIAEYEILPQNWDGEGASQISPEAIAAARGLALALPSELSADTAPNPTGTISFYLASQMGRAELEIGRTRFTWTFLPSSEANANATSQSGVIRELPGSDSIGALLSHLGVSNVAPTTVMISLGSERRVPTMSSASLHYVQVWAESAEECD